MAKTAKRINRRKFVTIRTYIIIAFFVLFGMVIGLAVGKSTASTKIEIPQDDIYYYDVPLSHRLQRFIYEVCADKGVPSTLVMAMIEHGSGFNPETVSDTDDYGLMQINPINYDQLGDRYRASDMFDPYQNIYCGIEIIDLYIEKYIDYNTALMAYSLGEYGAKKARKSGVQSTSYSASVLELMSDYEKEVSDNARGIGDEG